MKQKNLLPQIFAVAAALLFLGALGVYWPQWVGADSAETRAIESTIADAITYQGYLTNAGNTPLSGNFVMRFRIYNAASGGSQLWDSGNLVVPVNLGKFTVRLPITTDIFNGEELWVSQTVGAETLTPRQEIVPAPMAHTLRPGAVIKATGSDIPNSYAVEVHMNNNESVYFDKGAIRAEATTGNAIYGVGANGYGIRGETQDGYAVYGYDGGNNANRGYAGYFYSWNGIGVYGFSHANRAHPNIYAPGVYGESYNGVGVYGRGDTSGNHTFYNQGGRFEGGDGLYAKGTNGDGIYSTGTRSGIRAQTTNPSGYYDGFFASTGGISTEYVNQRNPPRTVVANVGDTVIHPGDLVAMVGIVDSPVSGEPMLAVAKVDATNAKAVIGVAANAMTVANLAKDGQAEMLGFLKQVEAAASGGYLAIITQGLAPAVNVTSLTRDASWEIGDKIAITADAKMGRADGATGTIVVGKVAGAIDPTTNTIPIFIDID